MVFKKKILKDFDFVVVINVILLCIIGIIAISSATHAFSEGGTKHYFMRQIVWTVIGLIVLGVTAAIDYSTYKAYYKIIYLANIALLLLVVVMGEVTKGANSWLGIGSLGIQPSEFMKISLIILVAKKIEDFEGNINNFKNLSILFLYCAVPLGLILKQPDLGTAMIIIVIIIAMLFMAGLDLRIFAGGIVAVAAIGLICWFSPIEILEPHQKERIVTLLNPAAANPKVEGYQINQSKTAIGSGQLFGMGFGQGTQNKGSYLPESHTDFIFSVFAEEFGFVGTIFLLSLYAFLIFRCIKIMRIAKDKFGYLVIVGVVTMIAFQMFQNIGMTIGIMPITGITLPFLSYGGSSMLTSMIGVGLVLNIGMRRHKINF